MKLNIPNRLTLFRIFMVPVFLILIAGIPFESDVVRRIVSSSVFLLTCLTDTLDGVIARRKNMITDLGKFLDPLADKFLVFAALLGILARYDDIKYVFVWAAAVVMFRELAVTSLRLIVAGRSDIVIAASVLGKIKTGSQMTCIMTILLEPVFFPSFGQMHILSYATMAIMTVMTIWSGVDYFVKYGKYITSDK